MEGRRLGPTGGHWMAHDVSGPEGVKLDLVMLYDVDGDGEIDIIACEEESGLGVVWYENPTIPRKSGDDCTRQACR